MPWPRNRGGDVVGEFLALPKAPLDAAGADCDGPFMSIVNDVELLSGLEALAAAFSTDPAAKTFPARSSRPFRNPVRCAEIANRA